MPFVSRDEDGNVIAIFDRANKQAQQELSLDHPDILDFLSRSGETSEIQVSLSGSDPDMGRVLEDLIQVLIDKRLIAKDDLPSPALDKISYRKRLRTELLRLSQLVSGSEDKII
jgi:hypothetical protein